MSGPHNPDDLIQERYKIIDFIGEGGMQFVYAASDLILKRKVALKTPKNDSAKKRFKRSAIISACVNHPNVAKTYDYFQYDNREYLIEELINGKDLEKAFLKKTEYLDPYLAARVFHYLAKGLAASHHVNVIHRDLKPSNIMVTGGFQIESIKITDFGIARMAKEEITNAVKGGSGSILASSTVVGALPYMAPEAIDTPEAVDKPADIWSIGAMMFKLLTGETPYGLGLKAVASIQEAKPPQFPSFLTSNAQFAPLANQLINIVLQCMQKDPLTRLTADALVIQCGDLCYPVESRLFGTVREIRYKAWGFIDVAGNDVFFHRNCVYGKRPSVGDKVMLSKFRGGGAPRAHPVVKLI
jgi:serine/threonine protein kinase